MGELYDKYIAQQEIDKEVLHLLLNQLTLMNTSAKYLERIELDESTWIWEIHNEKPHKASRKYDCKY